MSKLNDSDSKKLKDFKNRLDKEKKSPDLINLKELRD